MSKIQSLARSLGAQKWFHNTEVQLKDGCVALGSGSNSVFPNGSPQFTRMVGLHGPVCARQPYRGWLIHWLPVPLFCCQWKPCLHHLTGAFSPIVGTYLGATCRSGGCMVKNWTQSRWDDLKTVIQIYPFLSVPKGTPIRTLLRIDLSSLVPMGSWNMNQPTPLGASYCRRRRRASIWEWCGKKIETSEQNEKWEHLLWNCMLKSKIFEKLGQFSQGPETPCSAVSAG